MRYFLKRIMEGSFPGSPDVDYVEVTSDEWVEINKKFKGRWRDTKEQLNEPEPDDHAPFHDVRP